MSYYSTKILADSPQGYWRNDITAGRSVPDATGNGYTATLSSGVTLSQAGAISGDSDTSILFGASDTISLPYTLNPSAWSALSLEFWIKETGTWHHVVVTANATATATYLDGGTYTSGSGDPVLIDVDMLYAGSYTSGDLDEIALYNYVLSSSQVQGHFLAGYLLLSGGVALYANGTGMASFDHVRVTEYPDPALSLAPVLPRLGSTLSSWIATTPTNTTLAVKTSLDGVAWSSATNGGTITGLNAQPAPTIDAYTANTSANYTSTNKTGGSTATATFDATNRRLTLAGGSGALYLYTSVTATDVDILCDMDESDAGGLVWRYVDQSNYYELGAYDDSASGGFTNQLRLYKVASNVRSLLGTASTISWPRSTVGVSPYRRIRVTMLGSIITISIDGTQMQTYTDGSPLGAGLCGLRNDGGTSRYYQLRIQPQGDYVSGTPSGDTVTANFVYTQATLTTSDPSVTPQVTDLNTSARSPQLATGVQIPAFHDPATPFVEFLNTEMDNLALASGDYTWNLATNGALSFAERHAIPAPWCISSSDLKYSGNGQGSLSGAQVTPMGTADLYRNRQNLPNCTGLTATQNETKIADGTATSWQMAYPLYSAPTIIINGVTQTVGIQGVDTGKQFYWQAKSNSIGQDASALKLPAGTILPFSYVGQFVQTVTRDNLPEQAARAAIEGNSGIVEATEDGKGMLATNATTYANGLLARFGVNNAVQLTGTTTRSGMASGMIVPVFLPEHQLINHQMLITNVATQAQQQGDGTTLYFYTITATEGANLQNWTKIFKFS